MPHRFVIALVPIIAVAACDGRLYVRDGVTDGDTFYLPEYVAYDDDPVLQSWVAYSLDLSTCQLTMGGENPARNSSFDCEWGAHELLVETWQSHLANDASADNGHLNALLDLANDGLLREYVADEFARRDWEIPPDLDMAQYRERRRDLDDQLKPERRIVGSWNYADRERRVGE